ncbi:sensor histidine kinase [Nocardioides iriomotensis]|uniref:sensor histidine kinase n=1 Tax=Nocardioides iriomotensis TaxID=715784 RepID=UPI0013ECEFBB|nr:ATP-binding protein [Nocardioides iriomotensis]
MRRRRLSLAGQLLALQAVVVLLVVLGLTPVLLVQNDVAFRRTESRRVLATAENVADTRVLEAGLATGTNEGVPGEAERARATSGSSYVLVTDENGEVVHSSNPRDVGTTVTRPGPGRSWVGVVDEDGRSAIEARAPVQAIRARQDVLIGDVVGYVIIGRDYPTLWQRLGTTAPTLLIYVLVGSLVGLGGSLLLSRRIKRQTHGLEPNEIAGLVEHREAMLHGLREGVVGVDTSGRVTLVNDEAVRLLALDGSDPVGRPVAELPLPPSVTSVLAGETGASDLAVASAGRVLVLNQMPVVNQGLRIGWVTTVRDRTELVDLNRQLDVWRSTTDTLRSQAHEFSNRMHTIAGLIELEEYDEVAAFVATQAQARAGWADRVVARVEDAAVAALLVAKGSRATELGVRLDVEDDARLPALADDVSADLVTVIGNLVDNAMEAVAPTQGSVVVGLSCAGHAVEVRVSDDGPGVPDELVERVFAQGFSTKAPGAQGDPGERGWGLALCRVVCERRGGSVDVGRVTRAGDRRTVFTAVVPTDREVSS